jgi:hypothetical protein
LLFFAGGGGADLDLEIYKKSQFKLLIIISYFRSGLSRVKSVPNEEDSRDRLPLASRV